MADLPCAVTCADFIQRVVNDQPAGCSSFYHRTDASGHLTVSFSEAAAPLHVIQAAEPNQLYFFAGYPAAMLALMYLENQQESYLSAARAILDFCLGCHESIYSFQFAHKVAFAASVMARASKEKKYAELSMKIANYLLTEQCADGLFLSSAQPIDRFDQSAEIALWMHEISHHLRNM